jgi:hypothetical protein
MLRRVLAGVPQRVHRVVGRMVAQHQLFFAVFTVAKVDNDAVSLATVHNRIAVDVGV